jgi:hypothetical protein
MEKIMTANSLSTALKEQTTTAAKKESSWRWLYRLGSGAALASVLIIPVTIAVYFLWPPADSVIGHFEQFQSNWLVGLLGMDLLYLLSNIILIPTWLALYMALRRTNQSLMTLATILGLVGIVALIAARPILEMQALSAQYAAATTEMEQVIYLAAGEALLAIYYGTAFNIHYLLGTTALLISSWVMRDSDAFGRRIAAVGIAANLVTLGFYLPAIGVYISIFSVLFYWIWYFLIARRLWWLGR